jgi:hypothetical protein
MSEWWDQWRSRIGLGLLAYGAIVATVCGLAGVSYGWFPTTALLCFFVGLLWWFDG